VREIAMLERKKKKKEKEKEKEKTTVPKKREGFEKKKIAVSAKAVLKMEMVYIAKAPDR
jgi:hypothetical protein